MLLNYLELHLFNFLPRTGTVPALFYSPESMKARVAPSLDLVATNLCRVRHKLV
jgi:hypothetical protein